MKTIGLLLSVAALAAAPQISAADSDENVAVLDTGTNSVGAAVAVSSSGGGQPLVVTSQSGQAANADEIMKLVEETVRTALGNADNISRDAQEKAMAKAREALNHVQQRLQRLRPGQSSWNVLAPYHRGTVTEVPAIVASKPLDPTHRAEWQEDLRVMDKLLRDEVRHANGQTSHEAMGIHLWLSGQSSKETQPMYLEDYGALFRYEANFPLAPAGPRPARKETKPTSSRWEQARSEVRSRVVTVVNGVTNIQEFSKSGDASEPAAEFDGARVDALVNSLLEVLGEARNMRHLKDNECVIVTIAGTDDTGNPVRLTLKAAGSDIARFAEGKLKPEEFKKKVTRNLG